MAKKKAGKPKKTPPADQLPQNIFPMGERVEQDKNIYIHQKAYKQIHKFAAGKTEKEAGGFLVGDVVEVLGKTNILVCGFIEAKHCEATPTTLTFTHATWDYCHGVLEKKFPGKKLLGWIHTHPDFGIFLSEYDKFIHENFFREHYQIAHVVDPIQGSEGFYFWINGALERCGGFYIYDKPGTRIQTTETDRTPEAAAPRRGVWQAVATGILMVCVALLLFFNISLQAQVKQLSQQVSAAEKRFGFCDPISGQIGYIDLQTGQVTHIGSIVQQTQPETVIEETLPQPEAEAQQEEGDIAHE